MRRNRIALAAAMAFPWCPLAFADIADTIDITRTTAAADAPTKTLGVVTITGGQPTSLPTQIPTTMEGITRAQIEQSINATDSEDALKYFPSLLVRKRYIGDYNHAILSSRASGTGNSARSAVYADGMPQILHRRPACPLPNQQDDGGVIRDRQRQQLQVLELPSVSAAQLCA